MTHQLLNEIRSSGVLATGETFATVELGAATMLPSVATAINFPQSTCIAADMPSVLSQMEETARLNGNPSNLIPLSFKFGNTGSSLNDLKKLIEKRGLKRVDYIVCVEQIYDARNFS